MSKNNFLKENTSLVIGISLPVLLVFFFWLSVTIPKITVEPPKYDVIFTSNSYYHGSQSLNGVIEFNIKDGAIRAVFKKHENPNYNRQAPRLYVFDVSKKSLKEVSLDIPDNLKDGTVINIPELKNVKIISESIAPDGYMFDNTYSYNDGLIGNIIIGRRHRSYAKIEKDGRAMKIPHGQGGYYYYHNIRFLGWIPGDE